MKAAELRLVWKELTSGVWIMVASVEEDLLKELETEDVQCAPVSCRVAYHHWTSTVRVSVFNTVQLVTSPRQSILGQSAKNILSKAMEWNYAHYQMPTI